MSRIIIITGIVFTIPVTFFAQNWQHVGPASSAFGGGLDNSIESVYTDTINNRLYVSGLFSDTSCHAQNCYNFAYWDNVSWHYIGDTIGFAGGRIPFTFYQGKLFSANFRMQRYGSPSYLYFAYRNGNYWTRTDSVYGQVDKMKVINNKFYAIGGFDTINGIKAYDIAYKDSVGWHAIDTTTWGGLGFNGGFLDVAEYNGDIYIAGNMASYDGTIHKLAKWNGTNWSNVGGTMFAAGGFDGVARLCVYKGELYAGGYFKPTNGDPGWSIAKWNGSVWSQLGSGLRDSSGGSGVVDEMMVVNNKLVISGSFNFAGGVPANNIVEWDGTKFCAFGGTFDNEISTFASYNNQIYIANPMYADTVYICHIGRWVGGSYRDSCGVDAVNGINQLTVSNAQITVYPNPNNGNFIIETSSTEQQTMQVFDVTGKIVLSQNIQGKTNIDASNLDNGVYFIQVKTKENISTKKIIVQH